MGVKMGWIQIKMGHPLARNGAELAPFRANGAHPSSTAEQSPLTVDFQLVVQKSRRESAHARTWAGILNRKFCACVNSRRNFWTTTEVCRVLAPNNNEAPRACVVIP